MDLTDKIKSYAKSLGFHLVRIVPAISLKDDGKYFNLWLEKGYEGSLDYMKKNPEKRADLMVNFPDAKSVICLAMNYYQESNAPKKGDGLIARYAWGKDYHIVIERKLKKIRNYIIQNLPSKSGLLGKSDLLGTLDVQDFRIYADAGPILERAYAAKAGLGFIGKNTSLITKEYGSWVFLAEIVTTLKLKYDINEPHGTCGSCRRCIDACPTGAIVRPYVIDARKCISYQTIENKKDIPESVRKKMGNRIFGCDICQEVCPHNSRAKQTNIPEFLEYRAGPSLDPKQIRTLDENGFKEKYKASPIKRAGLKGIIRNIKHMV